MSVRHSFLSVALAAFAGVASAQTWNPEQLEVWRFEEKQWKMAAEKDLDRIDKMVHPNLSYWDADQPGPQNKGSLSRWSRYNYANVSVLEQEFFPITATITGNVAVAHYRYSIAREDSKKERETVTGRCTDILVREGSRWVLLSWVCGDDRRK